MENSIYKLLAAHLFASLGGWLYRIALPVAVYQITGSSLQMAVAFALTFLPFVFASLIGGVIADRGDNRHTMVASDLVSACAMFAIALVVFQSYPTWLLYVFVLVGASATPLHHPSFQAAIKKSVPSNQLARTNSLVGTIEQLTTLAAPVLSGLAIATLPPVLTFATVGAFFLFSAVSISLLPRLPRQNNKIEGSLGTIDMAREGLRATLANDTLRDGAFLFAGTNFAINLFQANAVFFLVDRFALDITWMGAFFSVAGAGAILGALLAPSLIAYLSCRRLISTCTVLAGLATLPMAWTEHFWIAALSWAAASLFGAINVVAYFTFRQRNVSAEMLGRAVSVTRLIAFSTIPVGALVGGLLYEFVGSTTVVLLCAGLRFTIGCYAAHAWKNKAETKQEISGNDPEEMPA